MNFLCIDTSSQSLQIALFNPQKDVFFIDDTQQGPHHSDHLLTFIQSCLTKNGLAIQDIQGIIYANGPGSYTGLRIGLSTVKSICYALKIPLLAVHCLDWLAFGIATDRPLLICNQAYGQRVYVKLYPHSPQITSTSARLVSLIHPSSQLNFFQDYLIDKQALFQMKLPESLICTGSAIDQDVILQNSLKNNLSCSFIPTSSLSKKHFAQMGYEMYKNGLTADVAKIVPLYVGVSAAEENFLSKNLPST